MSKAKSRIRLSGKTKNSKPFFTLTVIGPDGKVKQEQHCPNLVVDTGLNWLAAYALRGLNPTNQPDPMGYIAIGTNNTAATAADTGLGTELIRQEIDTWTTGGTGNIVVRTTFAAGDAEGAITECGLFNAGGTDSGTMFDRSVFSTVNVGALDVLVVAYSITFLNS